MSEAHTKTKNEAALKPSVEIDPSADLDDELRSGHDASTLKNSVRGKYFAACSPVSKEITIEPTIGNVA